MIRAGATGQAVPALVSLVHLRSDLFDQSAFRFLGFGWTKNAVDPKSVNCLPVTFNPRGCKIVQHGYLILNVGG
jgi:hypothetical protein